MLPLGCNIECRGCKHREFNMNQSLEQKLGFLRLKLNKCENLVEPVRSVSENCRWHYRSKTTVSTQFDGSNWQFGMWNRDVLIPIHQCPVHTQSVNNALAAIRTNIPCCSSFALAYVVVSGAQIVMVLKSKVLPTMQWLTPKLIEALQQNGYEGLWLHLNPSAGKRIFEKPGWHLVWGVPRSTDYNGLLYGPAAFQQLIPNLYNQSLTEACNFLSPTANCAMVDLYCGTGNSIRRWLSHQASVIGVELGGEAVECAKLNVPQAIVLRGACRQRVPQIDQWASDQKIGGKTVLMYVNPPRTGLEDEVLQWICQAQIPQRIAYLSCSPGTLSKNITVLVNSGYQVHRFIPFDFFSQTHHVECLALLQKSS